MLNTVKQLKSYKLNCLDGEIGKVKDFYFDDQEWVIQYLIADTGSWLSSHKVLISPHLIISIHHETASININLTKSQLENCPLLETDKPVSRQYQKELLSYLDYPPYWGGGMLGYRNLGILGQHQIINEVEKNKEENLEDEASWDPHLRSVEEVNGYQVQSTDKEVGQVTDFVIDENSWNIRYLVVDTNKWLPGKKVVVSPQWIKMVSWSESLVFVDVSSKRIEQSQEYDEEVIIDRDYEIKLYNHYNRKWYWPDMINEGGMAEEDHDRT